MRIAIEIPCCQVCFDWMRPVLLVEYPVTACVWVCTNGCASLMHGFTYEDEEIPEEPMQRTFSLMARKILERAVMEE